MTYFFDCVGSKKRAGHKDHMTSPSALVRLVLHHLSRPSHPASTSVTVATPLCNELGRVAIDNEFQKSVGETFFARGLEGGFD
jgi:hypothetical protein